MSKNKRKKGIYEKCIKRLLDIILSLTAIILISPVLIIVAILVRVKLGSPIIFKQKRTGIDNKTFVIYKFRTMTDAKDENGELLPDEQRLPMFGRKLRSTSLDELPELFNILNGNMSIIGPRPFLPKYLPYYTEEELHRHDVRPGLTGLAQVTGRSSLNWEQTFEQDLKYINNITFMNDLKIIFKTVEKVFKRADILVGDEAVCGPLDKERSSVKSCSEVKENE